MRGKVMNMHEAIKKNVKSGDLLFIGGAQHGTPSAAVAEIVRQRINHLTVISVLNNTMPLIGEGLVDEVLTGYSMTDERRSYPLQRARTKYKVNVVFKEYSHFGIALALFAGYMGVPFLPTKSHIGSDMMKYNDNIQSIDCPFTGGKIGIIRAVVPDVGILHVQRCDAEGNAQKWGTMGVDYEGINASKRVIITTEKIVDSSVIQRDPNRTIIPGFRVNAVVEQPYGAYPGHLAGCYNDGIMGFGGMQGEEGWENYVNSEIYGVKDWNEYLENLKKVHGDDFLDKIKIKNPQLSEPIITGI
jgi:glutaconate CoA-transferase subunit A